MKRFLSFLLTLAMLTAMLVPVGALANNATPTISITSLTEGGTYPAGSNISLAVNTNASPDAIKCIDFYANGDKLPGALTDASKSLIWYAPVEGEYAVTAEISYISGAQDPTVSAAVDIKVVNNSIKNVASINSEADRAQWANFSTPFEATYFSTENSVYANEALHINKWPQNLYAYYKPTELIAVDGYTHINIPYYSATDSKAYFHVSVVGEGSGNTIVSKTNNQMQSGWNILNLEIPVNKRNEKIKQVNISTEGYNNASGDGNAAANQAALNNVDIYINGVYLSNTAPSAVTAATSIPNGKTNICDDLETWRITFDKALATEPTVTVSSLADDAYSVVRGNNYAEVQFVEGALAYNTTYTVNVGEGYTKYGEKFAGGAYTFTTIDESCTNAEPIVSVVYPKNGATVPTTADLTAKVIFTGSVSSVEFFDGATKIEGTVTEGINGEYHLKGAALEASDTSHSITAKVNGTIASNPISVTAAAAPEYKIHGIREGDRIIANSDIAAERTIAVVGSDAVVNSLAIPEVTGVSKVVFKVDGTEYATDITAPYTFKLPISASDISVGNHTLSADVYDDFGVHTYNCAYTTLLGTVSSSNSNNYDETQTDDNKHTYFDSEWTTPPSIADYKGSKMLKIDYDGVKATKQFGPVSKKITAGDSKIISISYDFYRTSKKVLLFMGVRDSFANTNYQGEVFKASHSGDYSFFATNTKYHVETVLDYSSDKYITLVDGVEIKSGDLNDNPETSAFTNSYLNSHEEDKTNGRIVYLDNYKIESYNTVDASAVKTYALRGIKDGDVFVANDSSALKIGIENADNNDEAADRHKNGGEDFIEPSLVSSVVFKLNGKALGEAITEAPFVIDIPTNKIGANRLEAIVTDDFGIASTLTADYTVVYGAVKAEEKHNYDGADAKKPETIVEGHANAKWNITDGKLVLSQTDSTSNTSYAELNNTNLSIGTANVVYAEMDVNVGARYGQINLLLKDNSGYSSQIFSMPLGDNTPGYTRPFNANTPYKLSFIINYTNNTYTSYVDGVEYARETLNDQFANKRAVYIQANVQSWAANTITFDNYRITSYDAVTNEVIKDGSKQVEFTAVGSGDKAEALIANTTADEAKVNVYAAVYNGEELVSVKAYPLTLAAGEIKEFNEPVTASEGNKVKIFVWGNATLKPVASK